MNNLDFPTNIAYKYRGEGNCNLVLTLPKQRQILRIPKVLKSAHGWFVDWLLEIFYSYFGSPRTDETLFLQFHNTIMRPLIGDNYVCEGRQINIRKRALKTIEKEIDGQRPAKRRHKKLQVGRAALFMDFAYLPFYNYPYKLHKNTFAVEIKPKQGYKHIVDLNISKCAFCLNQYVKLHDGQISSRSSYCPLDLFSGVRARMKKAIENLLQSPQNNLQIIKNGNFFYGEKNKEMLNQCLGEIFNSIDNSIEEIKSEFCNLIIDALLSTVKFKDNCDCETNCIIIDVKKSKSALKNYLPKGCVLERILSVQHLDLEGEEFYYSKLDLAEDKFHVNRLLKFYSKLNRSCPFRNIIELSKNDDLFFVPYLISAVAKDCSLMVTFQKIEEQFGNCTDFNVISTSFGTFLCNIGVFDLYPKPVSTIKKHYKRKIEGLRLMDIANDNGN